VVAGTASAVNGRVQRHQAEKFAQRDAEIYAQRADAYQQAAAPPPPPPPPPPAAPAPPAADPIQQLKDLAELRNQGLLTDEEFAQQKARILGT
jgi:hypothetical protein